MFYAVTHKQTRMHTYMHIHKHTHTHTHTRTVKLWLGSKSGYSNWPVGRNIMEMPRAGSEL